MCWLLPSVLMLWELRRPCNAAMHIPRLSTVFGIFGGSSRPAEPWLVHMSWLTEAIVETMCSLLLHATASTTRRLIMNLPHGMTRFVHVLLTLVSFFPWMLPNLFGAFLRLNALRAPVRGLLLRAGL